MTEHARESLIVYRGPSMLDGAPILGVLSGLGRSSANAKTGKLAQLWILRADVDPAQATKIGADVSICGDCALRSSGCYVLARQAPAQIYKAAIRGSYREDTPEGARRALRHADKGVRLGAYGDPAALPYGVLARLTRNVGHVGYTHQWRTVSAVYRRLLMASVENPEDARLAHAAGWRTFRVRAEDQPLEPREVACPASEESGHRATCDACRLCTGSTPGDTRRSIAIMAHGHTAQKVIQLTRINR